jgi:hypothetical protein
MARIGDDDFADSKPQEQDAIGDETKSESLMENLEPHF